MTMPIDLVLVRHGQSLGNLASKRSRKGDNSFFTDDFMRHHSSEWPLTELGISQATQTGEYLRDELGFDRFDRYYASWYVRAFETAAYLDYPTCHWKLEVDLREREWGDLDVMPDDERREKFAEALIKREINAYLWSPPNGESMAHLRIRLRSILDTLHRECSDKRVIIVCHGEVMWGLRSLLERMSPKRFLELDASDHPHDHINNCQILHYTRRDPETGKLNPYAKWMRSITPSDLSKSSNEWQTIDHKQYTNEELLSIAAEYRKSFEPTL